MNTDLNRLRSEYARREKHLVKNEKYSFFNLAYLFAAQQRQRDTLTLIRKQGLRTLAGKRILEIGCGRGSVLLEYLSYGANPYLLTGADLLPHRVRDAHKFLPHIPVICADGQHLPYASNTFDIVMQYTVFSSILDPQIKANIAGEMLRVLNRSSGFIVWYDFWTNPTNSQTRGIRPHEVLELFPGCRCVFSKVTLAPPVARMTVPISWIFSTFLEKLRLLNTHYLVMIHSNQSDQYAATGLLQSGQRK